MAFLVNPSVPCALFEDEHLLVVNKPAGLNTHSPAAFSGEGLYDWLRHREPRWAGLALIQRLDKETSGVMVFSKTALASRALTRQFTEGAVRKKYLLLTDRPVAGPRVTAVSALVRTGEKYRSRPLHAGGERAETSFQVLRPSGGHTLIVAEPATGRTHQIRVHAAEQGFPILGDTLYGGTRAGRLCLHAAELKLRHPLTGLEQTFVAEPDFAADPRLGLRAAIIDSAETNAFRLRHGASDDRPGWSVDRLGDFLLSQSEVGLSEVQRAALKSWLQTLRLRGVYHKILSGQGVRGSVVENSPRLALGESAPPTFVVLENELSFELSFREGYSVGLFLDQRENRRRLLTGHIAADFPFPERESASGELLNAFAYTCGFSVCAAKRGYRVTSLDLSKKYLEWGKRNFELNALDPAAHDFICGDVFDWLGRWARKQRRFDVVVLDPPTFSRSRQSGTFQVERDYAKLTEAALRVLRENGLLFASTNSAGFEPEKFLRTLTTAIETAGRRVVRRQYQPQPLDFPVSRTEPAYLKTAWLQVV